MPRNAFLLEGDFTPSIEAGTERKTFFFMYRAIPFVAELTSSSGDADIDLTGRVGPWPFSAESPEARNSLRAIVRAANAHLGQTLRIRDGVVEVFGAIHVDSMPDAASLISALVLFLLRLKPYLDCIDAYLEAPGHRDAPGTLRSIWRRRPSSTTDRRGAVALVQKVGGKG